MATHDTREDLLQPVGCTDRFNLPTVHTIFKLEERLADRIRKRDTCRIYEGDIPYSPPLSRRVVEHNSKGDRLDTHHKHAGDVTSQCSSAQEQTPSRGDLIEV